MNNPQEHTCKIRVLHKVHFSLCYQFELCTRERQRSIIHPTPSAFRQKTAAHGFSLHSLSSAYPQETPARNTHASTVNEFRFGLISPTSGGITYCTT